MIRLVKPKDFVAIAEWFAIRNFPMPSRKMFPFVGMIYTHDDKSIAAGFLYQTDSDIAVISHLISNKSEEKTLREKAVNEIIHELTYFAKAKGYKFVTCATNLEFLSQRFQLHGFQKTDENVSYFMKGV